MNQFFLKSIRRNKVKNLFYIIIMCLLIGCTQKVSPPSEKKSSLLIIPQEGILKHGKEFAFKYTFTLNDEDGKEHLIAITPNKSNDFVIIDDLEPGRYEFKFKNTCLRVRGRTKSNCKKTKTKRIVFELIKNNATLLNFKYRTIQEAKKDRTKGGTSIGRFEKMNNQSINEYKNKFMHLKGSDKWTIIIS